MELLLQFGGSICNLEEKKRQRMDHQVWRSYLEIPEQTHEQQKAHSLAT
jgi:hypothetical protein